MIKKKTIKKIFLVSLLALTATVSGFAVKAAAENDVEVVYEYGLVCRSYKTESTNCTVKDPNGQIVTVRSNRYFIPEKAGVYTIEYPNKIVNFTVREYESAPKYSLNGKYQNTYSVGETFEILALTTVNAENYSVVEDYKIQVLCGDSTVYTTKENGDAFTLAEAGDYKVVYNYKNVYGIDAHKTYEFEVNADPVLVTPKYETRVRLGEEIDLSKIYGYYNGEKFAATFSVETPSKVVEPKDIVVFDEKGAYKITASVSINDNELSKELTFDVYTDLGNLFTGVGIDTFESDAPLQSYTNVAKGQKGIKIITGKLGSKVYYNTPIDLNTMDKNTNIIEFEVLSSELAYMSSITVKLIDVYDASNWVAITWKDCSHGSVPVQKGVHSYCYLSCSNGFTGSSKTNQDEMYFGTGSSSCMVTYTSCFHGQYKLQGLWSNMLGTFNCQFNYETKEFYTYDDKYIRQRRMADFDSVGLMGNYVWDGFTTGEAYLSIEFDGVVGEESGINVLQIAGKNLSSDSMKLNPIGDIRMDTDMEYITNGLPEGAVGYAYTIPNPVTNNIIRGEFDVTTKLYKVDNDGVTDITSLISNQKFTPTETGAYRVTYLANDAHGFVSEKSYDFTIAQNPTEIKVEQLSTPTPKMMSWFVFPTYTYSGGRGKLTSEYKVKVNGVEQEVENNRIFIDKNCEIQVDFIVTDYIGYQKTVTTNYTVDYGKYLLINGFPTALRAGSKVFFEEFFAYDFAFAANEDGYLLNAQLYIDGELYDAAKGYIVPSDKSSIILEYRGVNKNDDTDYIFEMYTIPVVKVAETNEMSGYFLAGEGVSVSTANNSVTLGFNTDGTATFINPVVADGLKLTFKINSSSAQKVIILLEDYQDRNTKIRLEIMPFEGTKSALYVNGVLSSYISGSFTGISYDISYDNQKRSFYDGNLLVCSVPKALNGNIFNGFSGMVKLTFGLSGVEDNCNLEIETIGNQSFGKEAYKKGDLSAPQFVFDREISSLSSVSLGYIYDTPISSGADVLKGLTNVTLTVMSPSGKALLSNVAATTSYSVPFEEYGYYRLLYKTTDGKRSATKELRFYVLDEISPEINIAETIPTVVKVGETIKLPVASVTDNVKIATQTIYVITPEGRRITVLWGDLYSGEATYRFELVGNYKFVYCVYDSDYNVARKTFTVCVMK